MACSLRPKLRQRPSPKKALAFSIYVVCQNTGSPVAGPTRGEDWPRTRMAGLVPSVTEGLGTRASKSNGRERDAPTRSDDPVQPTPACNEGSPHRIQEYTRTTPTHSNARLVTSWCPPECDPAAADRAGPGPGQRVFLLLPSPSRWANRGNEQRTTCHVNGECVWDQVDAWGEWDCDLLEFIITIII